MNQSANDPNQIRPSVNLHGALAKIDRLSTVFDTIFEFMGPDAWGRHPEDIAALVKVGQMAQSELVDAVSEAQEFHENMKESAAMSSSSDSRSRQ